MRIITTAIMLALTLTAQADGWRMTDPYFIAGIGASDYRDYSIRDDDDSDVTFRVGAGAHVVAIGPVDIGAEVSFQDLGQITGDATSVGVDGWAAELTATSPMLLDRLTIEAHGGGWAYDYMSNHRDGSDSDVIYGAALYLHLGDAWAVGPRWTSYGIDDKDVQVTELSVHTRF